MLYGLLLPSGNDAAIAIAEFLGEMLKNYRLPLLKSTYASNVSLFVSEMNKVASNIKMSETTFANPHGLCHFYNRSSCVDLAKLCIHAMKIPLFRGIVN